MLCPQRKADVGNQIPVGDLCRDGRGEAAIAAPRCLALGEMESNREEESCVRHWSSPRRGFSCKGRPHFKRFGAELSRVISGIYLWTFLRQVCAGAICGAVLLSLLHN